MKHGSRLKAPGAKDGTRYSSLQVGWSIYRVDPIYI